MNWRQQFVKSEGKRLFYMILMFILGIMFICLGKYVIVGDAGQQLIGSGITLLIGVGTLANNKARSPSREENETAETAI